MIPIHHKCVHQQWTLWIQFNQWHCVDCMLTVPPQYNIQSIGRYINETSTGYFFVRRLSVRRRLQWRHFLQLAACTWTTVAAVIVAYPGSAAGLSVAMLRDTIWNRYRQGTRHFSLSLCLAVACSLGWIGRVVRCYPPRTERRMEIVIFN